MSRQSTALAWLIAFVALPPAIQAQKSVRPASPQPPPSVPTVLPTAGTVEQGTYKNLSIGLEFTPAPDLRLSDPEMKGTPGAPKLLIVIKANDNRLLAGLMSRKELTTFYADSLAYYPEGRRDTQSYVARVIRANLGFGYKVVHDATPEQLGGNQFTRVDFTMDDLYEAVFVSTRNGFAYVFIFAGGDLETVNKLISGTVVKLGDAH